MLRHRIAATAPAAASGTALTQALQHSQPLVVYTSLRLLLLQIDRLARLRTSLATVFSADEHREALSTFMSAVREGVALRLPGAELLLAVRHKAFTTLGKGDAVGADTQTSQPPRELIQLLSLRALHGYRSELPEVLAAAKFDAGKLVSPTPLPAARLTGLQLDAAAFTAEALVGTGC